MSRDKHEVIVKNGKKYNIFRKYTATTKTNKKTGELETIKYSTITATPYVSNVSGAGVNSNINTLSKLILIILIITCLARMYTNTNTLTFDDFIEFLDNASALNLNQLMNITKFQFDIAWAGTGIIGWVVNSFTSIFEGIINFLIYIVAALKYAGTFLFTLLNFLLGF